MLRQQGTNLARDGIVLSQKVQQGIGRREPSNDHDDEHFDKEQSGEQEKERSVLTLWRFVSLPDLSQHRLRALFPLVGIALGVAVFIAVRVTNSSTLGAFARTVDAIAGRAGLEITGRGAPLGRNGVAAGQAGAGRGGCGSPGARRRGRTRGRRGRAAGGWH